MRPLFPRAAALLLFVSTLTACDSNADEGSVEGTWVGVSGDATGDVAEITASRLSLYAMFVPQDCYFDVLVIQQSASDGDTFVWSASKGRITGVLAGDVLTITGVEYTGGFVRSDRDVSRIDACKE